MSRLCERYYTPVKDILVYSFGNHHAVLMLKAFFDESGASHDSKFVCMGGCLASADTWTNFEKEWASILITYNIPCFHMTDFESNRGDFKGWCPFGKPELGHFFR